MTGIAKKPIPVMTDLTQPFWDAAREDRFVLQRCQSCHTVNFYPKPWCIECGSRDLQWEGASKLGTVYSYTVSRMIAMNYPGWESELPLVMCLIDLDDGVRMYGQVTECELDAVTIGMRVQAYFVDLNEDIKVPKFRPYIE